VREVEFAHFVRCKKRNWISSSSSSIHDTHYVKLLIIDVITKKELIREICRFSLKIYGLVWCIYLSIFIVCGKVLEKSMPSFLLICDVCHCVGLVWFAILSSLSFLFIYGKCFLVRKFKEKNGKNKSLSLITSITTHVFH
jgi:hypothetical protein